MREQSTRSMLRYAVRTGLTLEIEQEDFPAEWIFLWHRSCYKIHKDGSRQWSSLEERSPAYSSETGWPHWQRAVDQLA